MATKSSSKTAKTKSSKKAPANKAKPNKATKAPVSATKKPTTVHKTEPYHPVFGILLLVVGVIIAAMLIAGIAKNYSKAPSDAELFSAEYTQVEKDNLYDIISGEEAVSMLKEGTGVLFLGFPSCPWCQKYAAMLNTLAKAHGLDVIYYHNTYDDWQQNTQAYQDITSLLSNYLQFDNVGERHLYVPNVAFIVDGKVIANDWETSKDTLGLGSPEEYWTEERVASWKDRVGIALDSYIEATK